MKKNKLVALSLLAFTGVGALASCAGGEQLPQKVDVYFHAKSRIIVDSATGKTEPTEYIDNECATIEVKDKDKLKYGEQDVEITVRPTTKFFTFRAYDSDWYPVGAPIKPYVGLGNPHSLYNYPLEENVAWTFENKSTAEDGEAYLITVKKEFFQKNIVIDYGNAIPDSAVYAYTSNFYNKLFTDNLEFEGDFNNKNTYEMDNKLSAFTAAGKGAIITYKFKNEANPYTFNGWEVRKDPANNAEYLEYEHFSIKGVKEDDSVVELAKYNTELPSMDEQDFRVQVSSEGKYISFFIKWNLLAADDKDYTPLYKKIKMSFSEPTLKYIFDHTQVPDNAKVYECDFFQHPSQTSRMPFTDDGKVNTFDEDGSLPFENVFVNGKNLPTGEHVRFASIFKLTEDSTQNKCFSVTINNRTLKVDLDNPIKDMTKWHTGIEGETELQYWQIKNNANEVLWNLVQLNPNGRTYGVPEKLQKLSNLYLLYSTNAKIFADAESMDGQFMLSIQYEAAPKYIPFSLNQSGPTRTYGKLNNDPTADPYVVPYGCHGENKVDVRFYPEDAYKTSAFDVTIEKYEATQYTATYTPGDDYANIHIELLNDLTFEGPIVINLQQAQTKVHLVGETKLLGGFVKNPEDTEYTTECVPDISTSDNHAHFFFRFYDNYQHLSYADRASEFLKVFSYNGGKSLADVNINYRVGGAPVLEIVLTPQEAIQNVGFSFAVEFVYMSVGVNEDEGLKQLFQQENIHLTYQTDFNSYVGRSTAEPLILNITVDSGAEAFENFYSKIAIKIEGPVDKNYPPQIIPSEENPGGYELYFKYDESVSSHIKNGTITTVTLSI